MPPLLLALLATAQVEIDPLSTSDLDRLAGLLKARVAVIEVELIPNEDEPLRPEERLVYGIPLTPDRVACVAQLLEDHRALRIAGPGGRLSAAVDVIDPEHRVAVLATPKPLSTIGLTVSEPLSAEAREMDAPVFALVATTDEATAMSGVITDPGYRPEHEGLPTVSLILQLGMPVFDEKLRWVGFARTVAWDKNRNLLITPEVVDEARRKAEAERSPAVDPPVRPWWGKPISPRSR